jgi:hypothetical protein
VPAPTVSSSRPLSTPHEAHTVAVPVERLIAAANVAHVANTVRDARKQLAGDPAVAHLEDLLSEHTRTVAVAVVVDAAASGSVAAKWGFTSPESGTGASESHGPGPSVPAVPFPIPDH